MLAKFPLLCASFGGFAAIAKAQNCSASYLPTASVKNGTYSGIHNAYYNQDFYLEIPFAQPPVGDLRYRVPRSLNTTWTGMKNASQYSPICVGYGNADRGYNNYVSEDCLTLNVVRPAGQGSDLPVVVWIHGGGFVQGGSGDARYNLSFSVQQSVIMGKPHVAVSLNYRLQAWGFLYSNEIQKDGSTNLGLRDQRLALHWIQENIASFGGSPSKVTIWGQSAGGNSVGTQLLAYNGRDDRLFRAVIEESGAPIRLSGYPPIRVWQATYDSIVNQTGCASSANTLSCLRAVPFTKLNSVLNTTNFISNPNYGPVIDGDFITDTSTSQLSKGNFVKIPLLIGANQDEGTSFSPKGINTTAQFQAQLISQGLDNTTAQTLLNLYPDIPEIGIPSTFQGRPGGDLGFQYKRASALAGDVFMHAPRRLTAQAWAAQKLTCFSFHFNVLVNGVSSSEGSNHFQEVAFVFYDLNGEGYPPAGYAPPFTGRPKSYSDLALLMTRMWSSFVADLDPNNSGIDAVTWPQYSLDKPQNFYFDANKTSYIEDDYYRAEAIAYINSIAATKLGK